MEYQNLRTPFLLLVLLLVSAGCEKVDFAGMIFTRESANERFEDSERWNESHPFKEIIVPTDNYTILSVSDIHIGTTVNLDRFLEKAKTTRPAAVVMAGDLTWGKKKYYDLLEQHLPHRDSLTTFLLAGNHDCNFEGWDEFYRRFGSSTYYFKVITPVAADLYICLETSSATLGRKQFSWLLDILTSERPGCRRCIIYTHTNFFTFRFSEDAAPHTEELVAMIELIVRNRVEMVITGHDHLKDDYKLGNTTYIVMPALIDSNDDAGFLRLEIRNGKAEYGFEPV